MRLALIVSRFNADITTRLRDGAVEAITVAGAPADAIEVFEVPGAFEIAWAARADVEALPEMMPSEELEAPTVPPTVTEGSPFAWPVTDVTITDAQLGAAVQYQPDGAAVLVPAYELSDAAGNAWSVIAVVDDQLDFSATR